jgi:hypothetical protein
MVYAVSIIKVPEERNGQHHRRIAVVDKAIRLKIPAGGQ